MTTSFLLVASLLPAAAEPARSGTEPAGVSAYEAAKAKARPGNDAEAHVRLALWCEANGLRPERLRHLALAVLHDPKNITARGLLGLVEYQGRWSRPEAVAERIKDDEAMTAQLAEYNHRRTRAKATNADDQWKLGLWCEQNGLEPEASAHFAAVTRLDPGRDAAWKRLGCRKVGGRWVSKAQLAAEALEAEAQRNADKIWKPLLKKYRGDLAGKDQAKRAAAEEALVAVVDPRAVSAIWSVFVAGGPSHHDLAVQLFGQIDAASSSRALAFLAVFDESAEVRRIATEILKRRDPREFAGLLVASLRDPIKYEVRPVGGPGSPGALFVAGKRFNTQRIYAPPAMPFVPVSPNDAIVPGADGLPVIVRDWYYTSHISLGGRLSLSEFAAFNPTDPDLGKAVADFRAENPLNLQTIAKSLGPIQRGWLANPRTRNAELSHIGVSMSNPAAVPMKVETLIPVGQMMAEYQRVAISAEQQLEHDKAILDAHNNDVRQRNEWTSQVLAEIAGKDPEQGREGWSRWWTNLQGYAYQSPKETPRPTIVENVPLSEMPRPTPWVTFHTPVGPPAKGEWKVSISSDLPISCFGGGTLVHTLDGTRAIETLEVGDRVLSQDVRTGALGYQPITFVHHNPPSPTFLVKVGGDTIVSSPFHRFWVVGKGWVMARDLKGGETLRLLDGPAHVESVDPGPVQPVFNLDVAEMHDFFAGSAAVLVHDNTLPETRIVPFDTELAHR